MKHPFHPHLERRRIYLFRHAEAINAKAESMAYPGEQPLTENGFAQARAMSEYLREVNFDIAISSDFLRARQTAQTILGQRAGMLETSEHFRELGGDLKSMLGAAKNLDEGISNFIECMWNISEIFREEVDEATGRAEKALDLLMARDWSVALVVAHAGFNRVFMCRLLGLPVDYMHIFEQDFSGMSILDLDVESEGGKFKRAILRELNVTPANPAKMDSLLTDVEKLVMETRPLLAKLFS